jgi:undecaprenyl-diphosphatase
VRAIAFIRERWRRAVGRAIPPDGWDERFRVLPPWYVLTPLIALMPPMIALDGVIEDLLGSFSLWVKHESWFWFIAKQPGEYWLSAVATLAVLFLHPWKWRAAGLIPLAATLSALLTAFLKWVVGRRRPVTEFSPFDLQMFRDGLTGLFDQKNLCFPSGHATLAFSTATILAIVVPRYWPLWFAIATLCAVQRIAELAHYPGDTVAGAIVGILVARWCVWLGLWLSGKR